MSSTPEDIARAIENLRSRGVAIWVEGGVLRYRARKGTLRPDDLAGIRRACQLTADQEPTIAKSRRSTGRAPETRPRLAPLTFAQLAHWQFRKEARRGSVRQVASAVHLQGRLSRNILSRSVDEVVRRHGALRTRIVIRDGLPMQEIVEERTRLRVSDLTKSPESHRQVDIQSSIEQAVLESFDYSIGPLFRSDLLIFSEEDHVLITAMDHIIGDGYSMGRLYMELFESYAAIVDGGHPRKEDPMPLQLADYADKQRIVESGHISQYQRRWRSYQRTRFPPDLMADRGKICGVGEVQLTLNRELCTALSASARRHKTTAVMVTLTAYAALVMRWCNVTETVIQVMVDGRQGDEGEQAIGCLAYPLYLRARSEKGTTFGDLLRDMTEEYCRAYDQSDFGYAHCLVPRPEFTRNTMFNWLPNVDSHRTILLGGEEDRLEYSFLEFSNPLLTSLEVDQEPCIEVRQLAEAIIFKVYYQKSKFLPKTMRRFAESMTLFLTLLVQHPGSRPGDACINR